MTVMDQEPGPYSHWLSSLSPSFSLSLRWCVDRVLEGSDIHIILSRTGELWSTLWQLRTSDVNFTSWRCCPADLCWWVFQNNSSKNTVYFNVQTQYQSKQGRGVSLLSTVGTNLDSDLHMAWLLKIGNSNSNVVALPWSKVPWQTFLGHYQ